MAGTHANRQVKVVSLPRNVFHFLPCFLSWSERCRPFFETPAWQTVVRAKLLKKLTWLLSQSTLFTEYRIESHSDNEIWLEVHLDPLLKVLRSADSSGKSAAGARAPPFSLRLRARSGECRQQHTS
jgi:hypothetical protein